MSKEVCDYLNALVWDKKPRINRWLIDYAGALDTAFVRETSRAALVRAVRRARRPGCRLDWALVLEGPQGSGKSAALRILAVRDDWFTNDLPLDADALRFMEATTVEATASKWIVVVDELKGLSKDDAEALKACLSRHRDQARYVIVATTRETEGYLRDTTGNRRFWPICVPAFRPRAPARRSRSTLGRSCDRRDRGRDWRSRMMRIKHKKQSWAIDAPRGAYLREAPDDRRFWGVAVAPALVQPQDHGVESRRRGPEGID